MEVGGDEGHRGHGQARRTLPTTLESVSLSEEQREAVKVLYGTENVCSCLGKEITLEAIWKIDLRGVGVDVSKPVRRFLQQSQ